VTEHGNPGGFTWQKWRRSLWWRLLLIAGLAAVFWRGTPHEQVVAVVVGLAVGCGDFIWSAFGRYFWQGWRGSP
jgi:hypothetical protein